MWDCSCTGASCYEFIQEPHNITERKKKRWKKTKFPEKILISLSLCKIKSFNFFISSVLAKYVLSAGSDEPFVPSDDWVVLPLILKWNKMCDHGWSVNFKA